MVVVDEEADMVVAADTVVEMVELEDMEVAREVMAEEEHKDTIKAFKHFSSPHSSLFSKSIFRRRATTSPTKKCYLTLIQLKKVFHQIVSKDIPTTNIIPRQVILYQTIQPEKKMLSS